MAWNGTVTCSECYQTGHNKAGCSRRKERYEKALAIPKGEREWQQTRLIENYENSKKRRSTRKCTYCSESGHNRRKCVPLINHIAYVVRQQKAFRAAFLEHVHSVGLHAGSLVQRSGYSANQQRSVPFVVTAIHWDNVDITTCGPHGLVRLIEVCPLTDLGGIRGDRSHQTFTLKSPDTWRTGPQWPIPEGRYQENSYSVDVIGPAFTPAEPPQGWLEGSGRIKEYFNDRHSWQWPTKDNDTYYSCNWWDVEENQEIKESS
jgi:hypothetical protein|tara:strand:- start:1433 stop:2215 length:783 start_codon:yes stop_codon:yes gene_type:complete